MLDTIKNWLGFSEHLAYRGDIIGALGDLFNQKEWPYHTPEFFRKQIFCVQENFGTDVYKSAATIGLVYAFVAYKSYPYLKNLLNRQNPENVIFAGALLLLTGRFEKLFDLKLFTRYSENLLDWLTNNFSKEVSPFESSLSDRLKQDIQNLKDSGFLFKHTGQAFDAMSEEEQMKHMLEKKLNQYVQKYYDLHGQGTPAIKQAIQSGLKDFLLHGIEPKLEAVAAQKHKSIAVPAA